MSLNSYNLTKMSLVYGLFNQYLFSEAKSNIDLVERYFFTDPTTMDNTLIRSLLEAIRKYDFESIDEPIFKSILANERKTDQETNDIMSEIVKYKLYDQKQIDPLRNYLRSICYQSLINQANARFKNDPQGFVNFLKGADYHADYSNILSTTSFDNIQLSPDDIQLTGGWASTMQLINESYKPLCKYKNGQLVCITASPGGGKTLFLLGEELNFCLQGARVHHIALGDMKESDFIFRMAAIYSGLPFDQAAMNISAHLVNLKKVIGNKLSLTCVPAATITADQYVEYMRQRIDDYDVIVADYDSNFLVSGQNSLYTEGGLLYDKLTEFSQKGKLVFVASQPKIYTWGSEEIPMEGLSESSRKQAICDMILTIGRCPNTPNHIGVMKIAKNRRGEAGDKSHYVRLANGRFRLISHTIYAEIKNLPMKRNYVDADIDMMERQDQISKMQYSQQTQ